MPHGLFIILLSTASTCTCSIKITRLNFILFISRDKIEWVLQKRTHLQKEKKQCNFITREYDDKKKMHRDLIAKHSALKYEVRKLN